MLRKVTSVIRGYHEYVDEWEPIAEDEYLLKREPNNVKDVNTEVSITSLSANCSPQQFNKQI